MTARTDAVWAKVGPMLAIALLTGAGSWLMIGRDAVARDDMEVFVKAFVTGYVGTEAPWVKEKGDVLGSIVLLDAAVTQQGKNIDRLSVLVEGLVKTQTELSIDTRVLVSRFDDLASREEDR